MSVIENKTVLYSFIIPPPSCWCFVCRANPFAFSIWKDEFLCETYLFWHILETQNEQ